MRFATGTLVILAAVSPVSAADPLAAARQQINRGQYAEARAAFAGLKGPAHRTPAAVGTAAAWRAEGEYAKALGVLDAAVKAAPADPDLLAHRADLHFALGRWDAATRDADTALKAIPKHFLGRWVRTRLLRDSGDTAGAAAEVKWFVREYTAASNADKDITDPELLCIVGQAGAENARWHNLPDQFSFILNEVYKDARKHGPDCWQAEYLAGLMLLEKHNRPEAMDAFDAALKINPRAAEALVGKGQVYLQRYDLSAADRQADSALKVNPNHPPALRLKADVLLIAGEYAAAARLLEAAAAINPHDEHTLGRLAGCHHLLKNPDAAAAVVKQVETFDSKPAVFHADLAQCLEDRRRYADAEAHYRKAAELRPMLPGPRSALALLLLRMGREAEARPVLDAAFKADPFDVRVSNARKVLKHLDTYTTVETPHYVLRFDPKTDAVLAAFLADYLEEVHAGLKRQFGYEPPGKTLVELFSTHEMFSGRVTGLPDLHTVGACSGRVLAMASPKAEGIPKPFNLARVVRHELMHVFNLAQTDFKVPHWLTEGLAVRHEGGDRPAEWRAVLRERAASGELLDLDNIALAFARPKNAAEWALAYYQSVLYVEYLVKTHGEGVIPKLLDAYRTGDGTAAVLKLACGADKAAVESGYKEYVLGVAKASAPRQTEKRMTFAELEAAHKKSPDDVDLMAPLAAEYARRDREPEARKLLDAALAKEKGHPLAAVVKARILARGKDIPGARVLLEDALKANPDDGRVLLALARLHAELKDYDKAAALFERGRKAAPLDADWLAELARIYTAGGKKAELAATLDATAAADPDDLPVRVRLAKAWLAAGRPADAETAAREALFIDATNADARAALLDALAAQKKDAEVDKMTKRFAP
jgi:tetratricopeptide (TPR) repeat protein